MKRKWWSAGLLGIGVLAACGTDPSGPAVDLLAVSAVVPANGATLVDPAASIVVEFHHAMQSGMEQYFTVHEGDVAGPAVAGRWTWSADYRKLTFTPDAQLRSQSVYSVHMEMAEGMGGAAHSGEQHHSTGSHMGGGMMNGMGGTGRSGTCEMVSSFTTA